MLQPRGGGRFSDQMTEDIFGNEAIFKEYLDIINNSTKDVHDDCVSFLDSLKSAGMVTPFLT